MSNHTDSIQYARFNKTFSRVICILLGGLAPFAYSDAQARIAEKPYTFQAERVMAFGDVHGAFDALQTLLRANQIIDSDNRWIAGETHLVSLGDLLDRGARSREVMDLLRDLQPQALAAGGRVHVILGNHEAMNLLGDLRDVSDAEFASYLEAANNSAAQTTAAPGEPPQSLEGAAERVTRPPGYAAHRAAFAADGDYGEWLLSLPVMIKINDTLFVHGGVPALKQLSLEQLNQAAAVQLKAGIDSDQPMPPNAPLLDENGPLWYRGSAACHPLLEAPILDEQLATFGAARVVIGHTPTPNRRVQTRLQGRVTIIDTGMLKSVYRGSAYLLELTAGGAQVFDAAAKAAPIRWWHAVLSHPPEEEADLVESIRSMGSDSSSVPDLALDGKWSKASKAAIARLIASWRLDRELGLWMTPLTVADESGKRYLQVVKNHWITEGERRKSGRGAPNYCTNGHQNLLVAAFDALQGVTTRGLKTIFVHKANGNLRLAPISNSFGTSTQLPVYAQVPTIPHAMARKLAELNAARLNELLGDLLTMRQLKALLARRDKILRWPRTESTL